MLQIVNTLIKKFRININQIITNSDNTIEDIENEAFIVLSENYNEIISNNRIFINELKKKCLKFNKYGKRIESKDRWEVFNSYEENNLVKEYNNTLNINEDLICDMLSIKEILGNKEYEFLIDYYSYGGSYTANKYNIKEDLVRKRVSILIKKAKKSMGVK